MLTKMSRPSDIKMPILDGTKMQALWRNAKGKVPGYWDLDDWVCETIAVIFPEISSELDDDPPIETEAEARILRLTGIEQLPL
jgi:hypothetical protein